MAHQQAAVDKLQRLRVGALFQDPGTGKTRTAIELAARRQHRVRRVVWLCPVGAKGTIRHEILKHTTCQPSDVHVFDDRTRPGRVPEAFWYVVGLESLSSSDRVTLAVSGLIDDSTLVVADESDMLRTPHARRTLRATMLAAPAWGRLILTGTPVPEGVHNLFAQMRFLDPRILGYRSWTAFSLDHVDWSEKYKGQIERVRDQDVLASRIGPYTYQVTRDECLDLPAQLWDPVFVDLTPEQQDAYGQARWDLLDGVPDDELTTAHIYRLFTALQEIASGFYNRRDLKTGEVQALTFPHDRLRALRYALARVPDGEKVIVWVKFHHSLREVQGLLSDLGGVAGYHGALSVRDRDAQLAAWRTPDGPRFLLGTASTGGRALTLNEARYAAFYQRGFSYTENVQAELRNHRMGQVSAVTYLDVRAACGIEDRIADAYARKSSVSAQFRQEVRRVRDAAGLRAHLADLFDRRAA